tara:strand:- start:438 stop:659 length:222 start_codon:yes stop_codon:yes gene_type:complete
MEYKFTKAEKELLGLIIESFCDNYFYGVDPLTMNKKDWIKKMGWEDESRLIAFKNLYKEFSCSTNPKLFKENK